MGLKKLIRDSSLLVGLCSAIGCQSISYEKVKNFIRPELEGRVGVFLAKTSVKNLGKSIQTVSVHPDDASFLSGDTSLDIRGDHENNYGLKLGGGINMGLELIKVKAGVDFGFSPKKNEEFRNGLHDVRQQSSDFRPPEKGSFVFTKFDQDSVTYVPYFGVELSSPEVPSGRAIKLSSEIGSPYTGFGVKSGHDRFGVWENSKKDSWRGFGKSLKISLEFGRRVELGNLGPHFSGFLSYARESYDPKFLGEKGEIEVSEYMIGVKGRF